MLFSKKDLRRIIIPIIFENLLAVSVGMVDTLMVSSAGETAVSAVSLVDAINIMFILIFSALASGGTVVVSQYLGKEDRKMANHAARQLIMIIFLVSLGIGTLLAISRKALLYLVYGNIDASIIEAAAVYFLVTAFSYPFLALINGSAAIFRAVGKASNSMVCGVLTNVVNVIFNYVFIYIMGMGVLGAALATLIGRVLACILSLFLLTNENNIVYIKDYRHWSFDFELIGRLLKIAVPSGLENGSFQMGKLIIARLISSFGTASISANAIATSISQIQIIPANALGIAMLTVVGRCVGAGRYDQARYYIKRMTFECYLIVWILGLPILLLLDPLLGLYNVSSEAIRLARICSFIHIIGAAIFHPAAYAFPNCLRAANDARYTMIVSTVSMFTLRVGMSYLLAAFFFPNVLCVYIANAFDWVSRTAFFVGRYLSGKWMNRKLI
ncbi:MAG: MATE family efflux transporter [Erysipelotrichaceae bacterium]|nr:MATE family efflux transporter [Erysipelotrichaceae bacterium]